MLPTFAVFCLKPFPFFDLLCLIIYVFFSDQLALTLGGGRRQGTGNRYDVSWSVGSEASAIGRNLSAVI